MIKYGYIIYFGSMSSKIFPKIAAVVQGGIHITKPGCKAQFSHIGSQRSHIIWFIFSQCLSSNTGSIGNNAEKPVKIHVDMVAWGQKIVRAAAHLSCRSLPLRRCYQHRICVYSCPHNQQQEDKHCRNNLIPANFYHKYVSLKSILRI
jgi:hypothetical protein